jgi:hypothetical protein
MFKTLKNKFTQAFKKERRHLPSIVTFTGGMGAQIISAAIYFQMQQDGQEVYADLSYFDKPKDLAIDGVKGYLTHWDWQLHHFELHRSSFKTWQSPDAHQVNVIEDGVQKLDLGLSALRQEKVQKLFELNAFNLTSLIESDARYLCIHVRRGDYLNVASYLVADEQFIGVAKRFTRLVAHVVIVSDSPIPEELKNQMSSLYSKATFLDKINEIETHGVMRHASILVCSNSQFSLVAALLNTSALIVLPKIWFGREHPKLEAKLTNLGNFQILT